MRGYVQCSKDLPAPRAVIFAALHIAPHGSCWSLLKVRRAYHAIPALNSSCSCKFSVCIYQAILDWMSLFTPPPSPPSPLPLPFPLPSQSPAVPPQDFSLSKQDQCSNGWAIAGPLLGLQHTDPPSTPHPTPFLLNMLYNQSLCKQDKLQQASSRADRAASPEQGKLATRLRAELEVNKEALQAAKEESAALAGSLHKANSLIEVWPRAHLCGNV